MKRIEDVSDDRGITVAQAALAWLMSHKMNICAVLSPASPEHIKHDVAAADMRLTDEEFEYITGGIL